MLLAIAHLLETTAAALRRAAAPTPPIGAVPFDRGPMAAIPPRPEPVATAAPGTYPVGYWRCLHAAPRAPFDEFVVGGIYRCEAHHSSRRIAPWAGSTWSPFWEPHRRAFCYPSSDLVFTWIGERLAPGQVETTEPPAHVLERMRAASRRAA